MRARVGGHGLLCAREQLAAGVGEVYGRVGLYKPLAACLEDGETAEVGTAGPSGSPWPWPEREGYTHCTLTRSQHTLSVISNLRCGCQHTQCRKSLLLNILDNAFAAQEYGLKNHSSSCGLRECVDACAFMESSERYLGDSTYFMFMRNKLYVSFS